MFIQTLFTKRSFICSGVLAFILALTAPGLMGQDTAGATSSTCTGGEGAASITLHGTVTDPSQAILPDATVIVECGSFRRLTQTNATGAYSLTLPPGSYRVRVEAAGFSVQILQESLLKSQTSKQQDIMLSVVPATTTVSVTANPDYVADNSNTAMKTNTPLIEAPQSVTVVTSMQMAARDVQSVDQAISYTAGVDPEPYGNDPRIDWFFIRGFPQTEDSLYLDGLGTTKIYQPDAQFTVPPYALQSIDILKGPTSVLYGANEPGGMVNLVLKRPPAETSNELQFEAGSFDRYQGSIDFGGPVVANRLYYRLTGQVRSSGSQVNYAEDDAAFGQPSFTWKPDENTTFTLHMDYYEGRQGAIGGFIPAQGTLLPNPNGKIPTSFYDADPSFDKYQKIEYFPQTNFERRLNKTWTVRQNMRFAHLGVHYKTLYGIGFIPPDLRTLQRASYLASVNASEFAMDNQLQGNFRTGIFQHTVLAGFGYQRQNALDQVGYLGYDYPGEVPPIDVYAPVYHVPITPPPYNSINTTGTLEQYSAYLQDQIQVKHWTVALGGMEGWAPSTIHDALAQAIDKENPSKFTGRVGVLYHSDAGLAPYFSYATSFNPIPGVNAYGQPYVPDNGAQYEVGLKYQPRGLNSYVTASVFQITQNHVLTVDPNNPFNEVQTGQIRSRGVELEAVASLVNHLNLVGSFTHDPVVITKANDASLDQHPLDTPENLASLWLDYTPTRFGVGAGARFIGINPASPDNTLLVPGHTVVDAEAHFNAHNVRYAISAGNLLDKVYVAYCYETTACNYGEIRTITGTVNYRFDSFLHPFAR